MHKGALNALSFCFVRINYPAAKMEITVLPGTMQKICKQRQQTEQFSAVLPISSHSSSGDLAVPGAALKSIGQAN